jgi:hypothetical protein
MIYAQTAQTMSSGFGIADWACGPYMIEDPSCAGVEFDGKDR